MARWTVPSEYPFSAGLKYCWEYEGDDEGLGNSVFPPDVHVTPCCLRIVVALFLVSGCCVVPDGAFDASPFLFLGVVVGSLELSTNVSPCGFGVVAISDGVPYTEVSGDCFDAKYLSSSSRRRSRR